MTLEAENIGVRFGGFWALRDVSVAVKPQSIHGFIGPNGSGKTTLFNVMLGRYKPTTGTVKFEGSSIGHLTVDERIRRGIGIKFQITSIYDGLTVEENVLLAMLGHTCCVGRGLVSGLLKSQRGEKAAVESALDEVGLVAKRGYLGGELSHGERSWLEIAMALATKPRVLLLDEPTSGMGVEETRKTVRLVETVREGRTILIIEHDMEFVRQLSEWITVLDRGRILASGRYEDVKNDERVIDAYLGRRRAP